MKLALLICCLLALPHLTAGTVVITAVPDDNHPLEPIASYDGIPLPAGAEITLCAFPGLSDDGILDLAAQGGFAALSAAMVPFGETRYMGEGAEGAPGLFEIAVRDTAANPG